LLIYYLHLEIKRIYLSLIIEDCKQLIGALGSKFFAEKLLQAHSFAQLSNYPILILNPHLSKREDEEYSYTLLLQKYSQIGTQTNRKTTQVPWQSFIFTTQL